MSLKKMAALFVVLALLLCALPLAAAARTGEDVKAMVEALPALEALQAMSIEEQQQVYTQTQAAYDAYQALSEEARAEIPGAEETFDTLFGHFNAQIMPLEETAPAEQPEEKEEGIPWAITAMILALITTFLQNKFVFGRKR